MIPSDKEIAQTSPVGAGDTPSSVCKPLPVEDLDHILAHTNELWRAMDGKRLFITGGTGFFGIWLLEAIAHANDKLGLNVCATILSRGPAAFLARMPHLAKRNEFAWLAGHPATFAFPEARHHYLIHLATATSAHLDQTNPTEMLQAKLASISNVLEFARYAKVERMLVTSSGAVYGPQPADLSHVPETYCGAPDPMNPDSAYGNGKRMIEQMCALADDLHIVIARCFSFIGPHLPLNARFAAGNFLRDALSGGPVVVRGDGQTVRSYMYAADMVIWVLTMMLRGVSRRAYNLGSDESVSIADLANQIGRCAQPRCGVEISQPTKVGATNMYVPDIKRSRDELGLDLFIQLDAAVNRTWNALKFKTEIHGNQCPLAGPFSQDG